MLNNEAEPIGIAIDELNLNLYKANETDTSNVIETSQKEADSSTMFIIAFSLIMVIVLVALLAFIASLIIMPVMAMSAAAKKIARGDLNLRACFKSFVRSENMVNSSIKKRYELCEHLNTTIQVI